MDEYNVEIIESVGVAKLIYPRAILGDIDKEQFLKADINFLYGEDVIVKIVKAKEIVPESIKEPIKKEKPKVETVTLPVLQSEIEKEFENIPDIDFEDGEEDDGFLITKEEPIKKKVVTEKITIYKKETRTFIDKDGFEVTEETEIPIQKEVKRIVKENKTPKPSNLLKKNSSSKTKKHGQGVQQSFTAFLKKKH